MFVNIASPSLESFNPEHPHLFDNNQSCRDDCLEEERKRNSTKNKKTFADVSSSRLQSFNLNHSHLLDK